MSKRKISVSERSEEQGRGKPSVCTASPSPSSSQRKAKSDWDGSSPGKARNTRVIAFCRDGSTIIFDSLQECAAFFGIRRTDTLKNYIDNAFPMPDGSTFCDYLWEKEKTQKGKKGIR